MSEIRESFEDGKYEVIFEEDTGRLYATRTGELWRTFSGDKLVLAMLQEVARLRARLERVRYGGEDA